MKWLRVIQKTSPDCTQEQSSKRVIEVISTFFQNDSTCFETVVPQLDYESSFYDFNDEEDDEEALIPRTPILPNASNGSKEVVSNQLYAYLNDPTPGPEIWNKYGALKEACLAFNTPLTSSAPVERLFSFAGIGNNRRRNSLSDFF